MRASHSFMTVPQEEEVALVLTSERRKEATLFISGERKGIERTEIQNTEFWMDEES